jgi:hypothetical protein
MVALNWFNDELPCVWVENSLLPKNPTEAKLQATSTWGESTEPTKGVMKHTYKAVLYNYCLMQYCCILSYQLVSREGCNPNQREKYPNPWIQVQPVTGKAHNPAVIQHSGYCPFSNTVWALNSSIACKSCRHHANLVRHLRFLIP